jgi:hypothetical protein
MLKKIKKAVFFCILCLSVCMMFSACSGGDMANKEEPPGSANTSETIVQAPDKTDKKPDEHPGSSDSELQINVGDGENVSAKLPDTYPADVFPLYKDSFIVSALELSGSFTITAFSKDDYTEVAAFYKELLKDAEVTAETDSERGFTSFGEIGGYTYNFDTGASDEMDGYVSSVVIMLMPAQ